MSFGDRIVGPNGRAKRDDPFAFFTIHFAKHQKMEKGDPLGKIVLRKKVSQRRKKLKRGTF